MTSCGVRNDAGEVCTEPVERDAGLNLCHHHLLAAHDYVERGVGATDVLPSPCLACGSRLGVRYPSGWLCAVCEWKVGELADADIVRVRVDVVYYVRYRDRIKIGTSSNPRLRLAAILHDDVLAFERGDRAVERRRHAQFAAHRVPRSEWFAVHDELLEHIEVVRAGTGDPWARYALWVSQQLALGT